jgi:hypothetical protein
MGALTSVDLSVQFAGNSVDFRVEFIWQKIFTLLKTIHCAIVVVSRRWRRQLPPSFPTEKSKLEFKEAMIEIPGLASGSASPRSAFLTQNWELIPVDADNFCLDVPLRKFRFGVDKVNLILNLGASILNRKFHLTVPRAWIESEDAYKFAALRTGGLRPLR